MTFFFISWRDRETQVNYIDIYILPNDSQHTVDATPELNDFHYIVESQCYPQATTDIGQIDVVCNNSLIDKLLP